MCFIYIAIETGCKKTFSGPTLGEGLLVYKLALAQDAVKPNGTFPRTAQYVEECQYPEAFDPNLVRGSIIICTFSDGFYSGVSTINAIVDTARSLGFLGFAFLANPNYGDFIAEAIPFAVPGIMVPKVADAQVLMSIKKEFPNMNTCLDNDINSCVSM